MKSLTEQWKDELEFAKNMVKEAEHAYGSNPGSVAGRAELGEARQRLRDAQRYSNDLEFNDRLQESNARAKAKAEAAAASEAERQANLPKPAHIPGDLRPKWNTPQGGTPQAQTPPLKI